MSEGCVDFTLKSLNTFVYSVIQKVNFRNSTAWQRAILANHDFKGYLFMARTLQTYD